MFKKSITLSEVFRMTDQVKDLPIDKYSQEEYRQVLNDIMYSFITEHNEETHHDNLFS
tara:strand:- start:86 stop:259 length:174 start_codon:yes stop_codon:yes gene_type:complete